MPVNITVIAGGVGGAKFLRGLRQHLRRNDRDATIAAVVNTGDDAWVSGLKVCPDLDSITYALAEVNDTVRGWGRSNETHRISDELSAYGVGWPWFTLGDLDIGMHVARTGLIHDGATLTEATARLTSRWDLGVALLPMTDHDVETFVEINTDSGTELMHFQEWWVRHRAQLPANRFIQKGLDGSSASEPAIAAIQNADVVIMAPSNPVVSIGTVLGLSELASALKTTAAPVVGISPIINGAPVRGMADACLTAIGISSTADAVATHYGARSRGGFLDAWLIAEEDAALESAVAGAGISAHVVPLWMTDDDHAEALAAAALAAAGTSF